MPSLRKNSDKLKQLTKIYSNGGQQPSNRPRRVLKEKEVTPYPELIARDHSEQFEKQLSVLIEKNLKKKLSPVKNVEQLKASYKKQPAHEAGRLPAPLRTVVVSLEDCLLKTGLYKNELPRVDGEFKFSKLSISICFRKGLKEFLQELSRHYEVIAWTSSSKEYSALLAEEVEKQLQPFKFAHVLSQAEQAQSEDKEIFVKSLDVLAEGRDEKDIIILDNHMASFTNKLTNGVFVPAFELHDFDSDEVLPSLAKYLNSFVQQPQKASRQRKMRMRRQSVPVAGSDSGVPDFRCKIKEDFHLLEKFNGFKQNVAFQRIATRAQEVKESGMATSLAQDCESLRRFKSPDVRERFLNRIIHTEPQPEKSSWGRSRIGARLRSQWTTEAE